MPRHKNPVDPIRGRRFKEARDATGLDQQEAASRAGITSGAISRWENGKPGEFLTVARLAAVYSRELGKAVDIVWLLTGQEGAIPGPEFDPPYSAWTAFLETDEAKVAPDWAIDQCRRSRWPEGEPNVTNYQLILAGYLHRAGPKG